MSRMIQVRNVPDALHRTLTVRAAQAGLSLSDYLLGELRRVAERPTLAELRERIAARGGADPGEPAAAAVRAERDGGEPARGGRTRRRDAGAAHQRKRA